MRRLCLPLSSALGESVSLYLTIFFGIAAALFCTAFYFLPAVKILQHKECKLIAIRIVVAIISLMSLPLVGSAIPNFLPKPEIVNHQTIEAWHANFGIIQLLISYGVAWLEYYLFRRVYSPNKSLKDAP
jgi:cyanate permease